MRFVAAVETRIPDWNWSRPIVLRLQVRLVGIAGVVERVAAVDCCYRNRSYCCHYQKSSGQMNRPLIEPPGNRPKRKIGQNPFQGEQLTNPRSGRTTCNRLQHHKRPDWLRRNVAAGIDQLNHQPRAMDGHLSNRIHQRCFRQQPTELKRLKGYWQSPTME